MPNNSDAALMEALQCFARGFALLTSAGGDGQNAANPLEPISLNEAGALARIQIGKTTFWNEIKAGIIPEPYKLGGVNHWDRKDIDAYVRKSKEAQLGEAHVERLRRKKR